MAGTNLIKAISKLWRKRKAISPIVMTIIIIVIIIVAAIIVYFAIVPFFDETGELEILDYELKDTDATSYVDQLIITVENNSTKISTVHNVSVTRDGILTNWILNSSEYIMESQEQINIVCNASSLADELIYGETVVFTIYFNKKSFDLTLRIPAKFSENSFTYLDDFENFDNENWSLVLLQPHNPSGTLTIDDWIIEENKGNHYWQCTTNNCQFVILDDPMLNFTNTNFTCDLQTNDNDANGIIFRYDDSGTYPKFYIVWFTEDHPSPRNGPEPLEMTYFDWDTPADQIQSYKITIHYVEGDAEGLNWYKIAESDWTRNNNQWYTWKLTLNNTGIDFFIDDFSTPFMSIVDSRISHGYFGLISFENEYARYDNLYIWQ
ncbi:MAG: glycoside hydrolase family 61 protein [Asgard group archaeon]|nr:glycoside hydrolase family 61 protein [Asgard group archaeon]